MANILEEGFESLVRAKKAVDTTIEQSVRSVMRTLPGLPATPAGLKLPEIPTPESIAKTLGLPTPRALAGKAGAGEETRPLVGGEAPGPIREGVTTKPIVGGV